MSTTNKNEIRQIEAIQQEYVGETGDKGSQKKKQEDTRSTLARIFVIGFLGIVVLVLLISWQKGFDTDSVKDLLLTTSGILSGPLGFIIGYYFKAKED